MSYYSNLLSFSFQFIDRIYYAEVYENRPAGLEVVQVSATDPDSIKKITYNIVKGDTNAFAVNPQSGVITTKIPLDYETTNRYQLIVGTLENTKNAPSSSATVYINVLVSAAVELPCSFF